MTKQIRTYILVLFGILIPILGQAAVQYSIAVNNAKQNQIEATIGTSAVLKIRSGTVPASCATADAGTVLATMALPSDYLGAASAGVVSKLGTWQDASADATGTAGHFRIYSSDGTTCGIQGSVSATGGAGDITLDNISIASAQSVTISTFTITAANQ